MKLRWNIGEHPSHGLLYPADNTYLQKTKSANYLQQPWDDAVRSRVRELVKLPRRPVLGSGVGEGRHGVEV